MLEYEVSERTDDEAGILLNGELTGDVPAETLKTELERHFIDDGVRTVRVDVSGVDLIDLEGVGVLLVLWREANQRGKQLVIDGATGQVREKLAIVGLKRLFESS